MTEAEARAIGRALFAAALADASPETTFARRFEDAAAQLLPALAEPPALVLAENVERFARLAAAPETTILDGVRDRAIATQRCPRCGKTWEG